MVKLSLKRNLKINHISWLGKFGLKLSQLNMDVNGFIMEIFNYHNFRYLKCSGINFRGGLAVEYLCAFMKIIIKWLDYKNYLSWVLKHMSLCYLQTMFSDYIGLMIHFKEHSFNRSTLKSMELSKWEFI